MQGGLQSHRQRLRLQIRATQVRGRPGSWAERCRLYLHACQARLLLALPERSARQPTHHCDSRSKASPSLRWPPPHPHPPTHSPTVQCQAPPGRTYWSAPLELDALGGAAVVSVPAPLLPPTAAIPAARAAYPLSGVEGPP